MCCGDAAVGDDLDVVIGDQHVDQHAVVVRGIPDAELPEHLQRPGARREVTPQLRQVEGGLDDEADLPAVAVLALADRLLDRIAHAARKVPARAPARGEDVTQESCEFHGQALPAARGAAAAEAAASATEAAPAAAEPPAEAPPPKPPQPPPKPPERGLLDQPLPRPARPSSMVNRNAATPASPASASA